MASGWQVVKKKKSKSKRQVVQEEELPGCEYHLPHQSYGWHVIRSADVLQGSEGYSSGYHSWDVHVGHNQCWSVGVCEKYVSWYNGVQEKRTWFIEFSEDEYKAVSTSLRYGSNEDSDEGISDPQCFKDLLSVNLKPQRIRVQLDCDRGRLDFSDPDSNTPLFTFTDNFTRGRSFPSIYNGDHNADTVMYLKMVQGPEEQKVQKSLELLKEKLKDFEYVKTATENHIQVQARNTETQIKEQFENLRRFLQEEEEARMAALREEAAQKSQEMKGRTEALSRDMETISDAIRAAEDQLRAEDHVSFLQNYNSTMEGVQQLTLQDPPRLSGGALIDQAKHLKNLTFTVWDKMKDIVSYTPVLLDPNTACNWLVVSDDLSSLRVGGDPQQLPDNPERFWQFSVQGSEGFNSGSHSWDVEVCYNEDWAVGVCEKMYVRRGDGGSEERYVRRGDGGRGYWEISCRHYDEYITASCSLGHPDDCKRTVISVDQELQRIRVHLDWNRGQLSFSDPDSNTHLHTFTHTFTHTLSPFIRVSDYMGSSPGVPLQVLPGKICVTVENHR